MSSLYAPAFLSNPVSTLFTLARPAHNCNATSTSFHRPLATSLKPRPSASSHTMMSNKNEKNKPDLLPTPLANPAKALRALLDRPEILLMPCCFDPLSAKLIQRAGFPLTFMSGFATAASRGLPDTGLLSYAEMERQLRDIVNTITIPIIVDGDTGYGNALNVKRTIKGFASAGAAGILIEDQVNPKRCGHTRGKSVVSREEAEMRIRAAVDARNEGPDIVIVARTDAAACISYEEAVERCLLFHSLGADVTFLEAPRSTDEMRHYGQSVPGPKLANMLEQGDTPVLSPQELEDMGYKIAAYPLTLVSAAVKAMEEALTALKMGDPKKVQPYLKSFADLKEVVGFDDYYREEEKYKIK